jgi:ribonuclease BN (tRNA processing enzyme)
MKITYFWTWAALNPYVDTMYMLLEDKENKLYIDAWWGTSLMQKILRKDIAKPEYLWITHCHSDHLLWIVHVLRIHKSWNLHIFCSEEIEKKIEQLMTIVWQHKLYKRQIEEKLIEYTYINKLNEITLFDWKIQPLNLLSEKTEQYGFILEQNSKKIVFLWDEAIDIAEKINNKEITNSDRLLAEAFCLENEKETKVPHEKHHITAKECWILAHTLQTKNLIISHIDNHILDKKKQLSNIKNEAQLFFQGNIKVPEDNETINLW